MEKGFFGGGCGIITWILIFVGVALNDVKVIKVNKREALVLEKKIAEEDENLKKLDEKIFELGAFGSLFKDDEEDEDDDI